MKSRRHRYYPMFLAGVCTVMLLAGCGDNDSVHTEAGTRTEETAEADGTDTEAAAAAGEETGGPDETAEGTEEAADSLEAQMQASAARDQMEIDEETRRELTQQLLEEENMDTSVMEPEKTTTGCTFDIPEGFAESEDVDNMYVTKRYPIDASMIYYAVMEGDISLQLLTEEAFKEQTEENLKEAYGEEIEIAVDSFEHVTVSGYPAFRILCHYKAGGVEITQLEYAINADKSYMVTYSQTSDYDYMEAYEASAGTIRVE